MANTEREIFARNLCAILNKSHIRPIDIANELEISKGTVRDYMTGRCFPRPDKLATLCKLLGVSQYDLTTDFHKEIDDFVPNREVLALAKEIYENPDARSLYLQIRALDENKIQNIRNMISEFDMK